MKENGSRRDWKIGKTWNRSAWHKTGSVGDASWEPCDPEGAKENK
jgi:hypothetical protein